MQKYAHLGTDEVFSQEKKMRPQAHSKFKIHYFSLHIYQNANCPFLGLFFTPGILACFPAGDQLHMLLRVEICTLLKSRRVLHLHVMSNSNFEAVEMKLNKTLYKTLCGPFLPKSVLISRWWPVTSYLAMLYFATLQHRL